MKKTLQISLEDAKEMIKVLPAMKDTLEELYPELKPSVVPDSWYKIDGRLRGFYIHTTDGAVWEECGTLYTKRNTNIFATEKQAKSALAYAQLTQLMKATGDCNVDWIGGTQKKYAIIADRLKCKIVPAYNHRYKLTFNTYSVAREFLEKHRGLIDVYYEL